MQELKTGSYGPWCRAIITQCSDPDFWYADRIGDVITVRHMPWTSGYVEAKNGRSVLKFDLAMN